MSCRGSAWPGLARSVASENVNQSDPRSLNPPKSQPQAIDIKKEAISAVEESGIVFIDEIDKICSSGAYRGECT